MTENTEDKIKEYSRRLKNFQAQYESYSQDNAISKSNNEASRKINAILLEKACIEESDLFEIKRLIDWTEGQPHWDGVSWMDYKMHVRAYLSFKGYKIVLRGI